MLHIFRNPQQLAIDSVGLHTFDKFIDFMLRFVIVKIAALKRQTIEQCAGGMPQTAGERKMHHMDFLTERSDFFQGGIIRSGFIQSNQIKLMILR